MPAERIAMRQVREVRRLTAAGVSGNEIARRVGVASSTVRLTLKRLGVGPEPIEALTALLKIQGLGATLPLLAGERHAASGRGHFADSSDRVACREWRPRSAGIRVAMATSARR
jgi:hypothetical protein